MCMYIVYIVALSMYLCLDYFYQFSFCMNWINMLVNWVIVGLVRGEIWAWDGLNVKIS